MNNNDIFYKAEKELFNEDLRVKGINGYLLLRAKIYYAFMKRKYGYSAKTRKSTTKELLINFTYGFSQLFRIKKYSHIFFTNTNKRELIDGLFVDVLFDAWADKLGQDNVLFIERASTGHVKKKLAYSKNIISDIIFKLLTKIVSIFILISKNESSKLQDLQLLQDYPVNVQMELKEKIGEIIFYKFLFKITKPKSIFVLSSYSKTPIVLAAHLLRIKVYEPQHGFIGKNHLLYNKPYGNSRLYYPDILLAFGNYEKEKNNNQLAFSRNQIIPVGSYYLEYIKDTFNDDFLNQYTSKYKKVFCVTLQSIEEKNLLDWIAKHAAQHNDWLFILRPKYSKDGYEAYLKHSNIVMLEDYNIYHVLIYSHYNITIYSTTAVESSFFDVKTIFYNVEQLSEKYYQIEDLYASIVNPGDLITDEHLNNDNKENTNYFEKNYFKNVQQTKI